MTAEIQHKAPHPALLEALFCYAHTGDGASAVLIQSWDALVRRVVDEVGGDDWPDALAELENWQRDGWGRPLYFRQDFEGGEMTVVRVQRPVLERVVPGRLTTDMLNAGWATLVPRSNLSGEAAIQTLTALWYAFLDASPLAAPASRDQGGA